MKKCFIISPIGEEDSDIRKRSDEILNYIIKPTLNEFSYEAIRADEISEFGLITNQIIYHIVYDDLVICDLTYRNPNVYYELAIRHIVQKPIIQLIDEDEDLSFDIINTRTIKINHRSLTGANSAKDKIKQYLARIESGTYKIETPTSNVIDLNTKFFDNSPTAHISKAYSKIFDLLTEQQNHFNKSQMPSEYDKLKETNKLKSQFIINLTQELRTPLIGIMSFASLLAKEDMKPEMKEIIDSIVAAAERLVKTTNFINENLNSLG